MTPLTRRNLGMKEFFNKLLKIGYELGQQTGTNLPDIERLLPPKDMFEMSLQSFIKSANFDDVFSRVASVVNSTGGTLLIENVDDYLSISFVVMDSWTPKRLVILNVCHIRVLELCVVCWCQVKLWSWMNLSISCWKTLASAQQCAICSQQNNKLLKNVQMTVLNSSQCVLVHFWTLLQTDYSTSHCLNKTTMLQLWSSRRHWVSLVLKSSDWCLDQLSTCFEFLLMSSSLSDEIRSVLNLKVDSRWFSHSVTVEKTLILLAKHFDKLIECIEQLDTSIDEKQKVTYQCWFTNRCLDNRLDVQN